MLWGCHTRDIAVYVVIAVANSSGDLPCSIFSHNNFSSAGPRRQVMSIPALCENPIPWGGLTPPR